MRTSRILGLLLWVASCGGQPAQTETPEPAADDPMLEGEPAASEAKEPGAAPGLKASDDAPAAVGDDATAILQLVIEDPELDPYLKLGEPGRFPLKLSGDKIPPDVKLVKGAKPVEIVSAPKSNKDPVLVVTEFAVQGNDATVRYQYGAEGIRGTARLTKSPHGWELKSSRIVEHKASATEIGPAP